MSWFKKLFSRSQESEHADKSQVDDAERRSTTAQKDLSSLRSLTVVEQLGALSIHPSITDQVLAHIRSGGERTPVDELGMNFRLYSNKDGSVNFEMLGRNTMGLHFKPIAYYEVKGSMIEAYVLNEFIRFAKQHSNINSKISVKALTLKENAIIGASSHDMAALAQHLFQKNSGSPAMPLMIENMQYQKVTSNGLNISIQSSAMGALETNLEDEAVEDLADSLLVLYQNRDGLSVHCVDPEYKKLSNLELVGALKGL